MKKIVSLIAAVLIAANVLVVNTLAAFAPVVAGAEVVEVLIALLIGAGHSQSELDGMSVTEMQSLVNDDLNSGRLNADTLIKDPVLNTEMKLIDYYNNFSKTEEGQATAFVVSAIRHGVADFVKDAIIESVGITGDVSPVDLVIPTSTTNLMGNGAFMYRADLEGWAYGCDYIVLDLSHGSDDVRVANFRQSGYVTGYLYVDGKWKPLSGNNSGTFASGYKLVDDTLIDRSGNVIKLCGDVRTIDGEPFPTDDEFEYQIGELPDGTKVTVDMLNPDGTVTIDGVTYDPADYLDPDKLTEEGKKQLVYNISNVITNTYVKAEDEPLVDADDITVEVSESLDNFTVPKGITTVFPFCLPFDFVRGLKLFSASPKTPHFEVTINVPPVLSIPAQKWELVIDLGKFEPLARITRWLSLFGFSYLLISLSTKIVKGAGA